MVPTWILNVAATAFLVTALTADDQWLKWSVASGSVIVIGLGTITRR